MLPSHQVENKTIWLYCQFQNPTLGSSESEAEFDCSLMCLIKIFSCFNFQLLIPIQQIHLIHFLTFHSFSNCWDYFICCCIEFFILFEHIIDFIFTISIIENPSHPWVLVISNPYSILSYSYGSSMMIYSSFKCLLFHTKYNCLNEYLSFDSFSASASYSSFSLQYFDQVFATFTNSELTVSSCPCRFEVGLQQKGSLEKILGKCLSFWYKMLVVDCYWPNINDYKNVILYLATYKYIDKESC